jgi:hypothetical protein
MQQIKFTIKNTLETDNLLYEHFDQSTDLPPQMDLINDVKQAKNLVETFEKSEYKITVKASAGKGINPTFDLVTNDMSKGGGFTIHTNSKRASLVAEVDGEFTVNTDDDTAKQLKKAYSLGKLQFYIINFGARKEVLEPYSYKQVSGKIADGDWDNDDSWPKVISYDSDIFAKKIALRKTPTINIPVKINTKITIDSTKIESVKKALADGLTMRIGLTIPGGVTGFLVNASDWDGITKFSLKGNLLAIKIDAFYTAEIDSWIRKYKSQAPFGIELDCIFDSNSELHYFGEKDASGSFSPIKVGEISV